MGLTEGDIAYVLIRTDRDPEDDDRTIKTVVGVSSNYHKACTFVEKGQARKPKGAEYPNYSSLEVIVI